MILGHPIWVWVLVALGVIGILVATIVLAVEFSLSRRLREIKGMFRDALNHARSFDGLVEKLRAERKEDRDTLVGTMEIQGKHGERLAELESWRRSVEELPIIRAEKVRGG